jgi:hypothetical protein
MDDPGQHDAHRECLRRPLVRGVLASSTRDGGPFAAAVDLRTSQASEQQGVTVTKSMRDPAAQPTNARQDLYRRPP